MTKQDACDNDLIDLDPDCVVRPIGVVQATSTREVYKPSDCTNWKFLKSGKTMEVATGSCLLIKHRLGFIQAQFFEPGSIKGPLVFAEATIEEPKEALRQSSDFVNEVLGYALGVFVCVGTSILSYFLNRNDDFSAVDFGIHVIMGLGCGLFAVNLFKALKAGFSSDSNAIEKLKSLEAETFKNGREVRPPDLNLERCASVS